MAGIGPMKGMGGRPPMTADRLLASATYLRDPGAMANRINVEQASGILKLGLPSPEIVADPYAHAQWLHLTTHAIWLRETDRLVVEMVCFASSELAQQRLTDRGMCEKTMNVILRIMAMLGCVSTTRNRVIMQDQPAGGEKAKKGNKYGWGGSA